MDPCLGLLLPLSSSRDYVLLNIARPCCICCMCFSKKHPRSKQDHGVLKICGRDAAVDYSITKEKYNAMKQSAPSAPAAAAENVDDDEDDGGEKEGEGGGEGDGDGMDVDSDEEDGSGDDSDDDEDEAAQQREGGPDAGAGVGRAPEKQQRAPDVNHGCTVFVRNVAFDSAQEEIKDRFSEFGDVRLALLVKDRATGMPRGTAFVKVRAGRVCLSMFGQDPAVGHAHRPRMCFFS